MLRNSIYFHDGGSAYNLHHVSEYLSHCVCDWIGNAELDLWPTRSPKVIQLDFFFGVLLEAKCTNSNRILCRNWKII